MVLACSLAHCSKPARARGWCNRHYKRWRRHGDPRQLLQRQRPQPPVCTLAGCDRKPHARGWCHKHWERWRRHGDPRTVLQHQRPDKARWTLAGLLARTGAAEPPYEALERPCRLWTGAKDADGYGFAKHAGRQWRTHRLAYVLAHGPPIPGLLVYVTHRCDRPACVEPSHLALGTPTENSRDACQRGRRA